MSQQLKIIFAGTPEFALPTLETLLASRHKLCAVYTQPDRSAGRGRKLKASPVKELALKHNIAVRQPQSLKNEAAQQTLKDYAPDVMVVVAYGLLLPQAVLDIPRYGCVNVHASLLPRWRGAAPIQRAILAGDHETGVCIMRMEAGLDTGPVYRTVKTAISANETGASLHDRLASLGNQALLDTLDDFCNAAASANAQDDAKACYASKLSKAEAQIDWQHDAAAIERMVRAFNPWPVAYFNYNNETIRVWQATALDTQHHQPPGTVLRADKHGIDIACAKGALRIMTLQRSGAKAMDVAAFLNARADFFK